MTWDGTQWLFDTDGDGYADQSGIDSGGDGHNDIWQIDRDGDGYVDRMAFDMDGDGADDTWTDEADLVPIGDWSGGWVLPNQGAAPTGFAVGGTPFSTDSGMMVDPFADIIALAHADPTSGSLDLDYQIAMGLVTPSLIEDAMGALHDAQSATSPGHVPSEYFPNDGEYRDYNSMWE
jgi:hypothetical protein